ncbi:MAG: hypothetical protein Q8J67_04760, partial [Rhodocyclaceae bacterium]|nr:hypothetical protein [Rhodocyclaceae bacterium]
TGIDMCRNADVAIALNGCLAGHLNYLSFSNQTTRTRHAGKAPGQRANKISRRTLVRGTQLHA